MREAAADDEIRAAGCVLWRPGASGPEIALVHRLRYDDWSLPKGKREPGEHLLETAVREVAEETGVEVVLGRRLRSTKYRQDRGSGKSKVVDYWAARPAIPGPQPEFVPNDEVDRLDWLPVPAARARLSYARDTDVLDDFASGAAETVPCVLVRHASAGTKEAWRAAGHADELRRRLDARGLRDSRFLARLLRCYAGGSVISSAAERCVATVRPYAAFQGRAVESEPAFTVGPAGGEQSGRSVTARRRIEELVGGGLPAVICAHRENLPDFLDWACARLNAKPPEGPPLGKGSFWVLHIGGGTVTSAERHNSSAS